jgi:predicted ATP-grasp superfamily ATP-dependent carboligase
MIVAVDRDGMDAAGLRSPAPGSLSAAALAPAYVLGGHEAGLAVTRSLGEAGVPVVCVWHTELERARASRHVEASVRAPDPWLEPERYVDLMLELERRFGRGLIVATTDETVIAVARHRETLETRHLLATPSWAVAEQFIDKHRTYALAERLGVTVPKTVLPESEEELAGIAPDLPYPCVVKPRLSHLYRDAFGVKMTKVHGPKGLVATWRRAAQAGIDVLVQEYIPGPERCGVNYNGYLVDGGSAAEMTARKVRLFPCDLGYPSVVVSKQVPEVLEPSRRLLRGMGMTGFANVEFKRDERDGAYTLMEVNGRPNMSGLLALRCGVNFPLMTYRDLVLGKPPPTAADTTYEQGVYWINESADVPGAASRVRAGRLSLRNFLAPYLRPHVFASISASDASPFLTRAISKLGGKLKASIRAWDRANRDALRL